MREYAEDTYENAGVYLFTEKAAFAVMIYKGIPKG